MTQKPHFLAACGCRLTKSDVLLLSPLAHSRLQGPANRPRAFWGVLRKRLMSLTNQSVSYS